MCELLQSTLQIFTHLYSKDKLKLDAMMGQVRELIMFAVLDPLETFTISSAGSKAPDFAVGFGGSSMSNINGKAGSSMPK